MVRILYTHIHAHTYVSMHACTGLHIDILYMYVHGYSPDLVSGVPCKAGGRPPLGEGAGKGPQLLQVGCADDEGLCHSQGPVRVCQTERREKHAMHACDGMHAWIYRQRQSRTYIYTHIHYYVNIHACTCTCTCNQYICLLIIIMFCTVYMNLCNLEISLCGISPRAIPKLLDCVINPDCTIIGESRYNYNAFNISH